jgi:hypothetical protein
MKNKSNDTTHVYERISKQELFSFMNSPEASESERGRLYSAFIQNADLFKTIRHGKTIVLGIKAAKKYISDTKKELNMLLIAMIVALLSVLSVVVLMTEIISYRSINFFDISVFIALFVITVFFIVYLFIVGKEFDVLNMSEEHVERGLIMDKYNINFEIKKTTVT